MSSAGMPTVRLPGPHDRWEYRVIALNVTGFFGPSVDINQLGEYLNDAGDDGWELVTIVDLNRGNGATAELLGVLKRLRR